MLHAHASLSFFTDAQPEVSKQHQLSAICLTIWENKKLFSFSKKQLSKIVLCYQYYTTWLSWKVKMMQAWQVELFNRALKMFQQQQHKRKSTGIITIPETVAAL